MDQAALTGLAVALGVSIGTPIANALRRPAIQSAIDTNNAPLREQNKEQAAQLARNESEIRELRAEVREARAETRELRLLVAHIQGMMLGAHVPVPAPAAPPPPAPALVLEPA